MIHILNCNVMYLKRFAFPPTQQFVLKLNPWPSVISRSVFVLVCLPVGQSFCDSTHSFNLAAGHVINLSYDISVM